MTQPAILYPVFVQVTLTFVLLFWMGVVRVRTIQARKISVADVALGQDRWPPEVQKISNSYHNQFQTPVLFFVVVAFALMAGKVNGLLIMLAWGFVALRIVHAAIHTTTNRVQHRFMAFLAGTIVLVMMWLVFFIRVVFEGI